MALCSLQDWLAETDDPAYLWFVKRLAANDTLATQSNQAGPYVPKSVLFRAFPAIDTAESKNPDVWFELAIDSHEDRQRSRAIYYNSRRRGEGTRDEARITNLGGTQSALLDPESTGALAVFAFHTSGTSARVWVCRHRADEDEIEERIGTVEPGQYTVWTPGTGQLRLFLNAGAGACNLPVEQVPQSWLTRFPTGEELIGKAVELCGCDSASPDTRLLRRRKCEFELFQSLERAFWLPRIQNGFSTIESFLSLAQTLLQSRKARSGNSLELHVRRILEEEGMREREHFQSQPVTEDGKRPDFVFPSAAAYRDASFPAGSLRMLAVKTTCKDRWRQILNEADRIPAKHLLTVQEGVSEAQFREMYQANVRLVVPAALQSRYPAAVQPHLLTLESFIAEARQPIATSSTVTSGGQLNRTPPRLPTPREV